jgi:hypothetical protein
VTQRVSGGLGTERQRRRPSESLTRSTAAGSSAARVFVAPRHCRVMVAIECSQVLAGKQFALNAAIVHLLAKRK